VAALVAAEGENIQDNIAFGAVKVPAVAAYEGRQAIATGLVAFDQACSKFQDPFLTSKILEKSEPGLIFSQYLDCFFKSTKKLNYDALG
jgi:hypothetical protein